MTFWVLAEGVQGNLGQKCLLQQRPRICSFVTGHCWKRGPFRVVCPKPAKWFKKWSWCMSRVVVKNMVVAWLFFRDICFVPECSRLTWSFKTFVPESGRLTCSFGSFLYQNMAAGHGRLKVFVPEYGRLTWSPVKFLCVPHLRPI